VRVIAIAAADPSERWRSLLRAFGPDGVLLTPEALDEGDFAGAPRALSKHAVLVHAAASRRPDIGLLITPLRIEPASLRECDFPLVLWAAAEPFWAPSMERFAANCALFVSSSDAACAEAEAAGFKRALFLPPPPAPWAPGFKRAGTVRRDAAVIGAWHPRRQRVLSTLVQAGLRAFGVGPGWSRAVKFGLSRSAYRVARTEKEVIEAAASATLSVWVSLGGFSPLLSDALAAGLCIVAPPFPEAARLSEAVAVDEDCAAKAKELLDFELGRRRHETAAREAAPSPSLIAKELLAAL